MVNCEEQFVNLQLQNTKSIYKRNMDLEEMDLNNLIGRFKYN